MSHIGYGNKGVLRLHRGGAHGIRNGRFFKLVFLVIIEVCHSVSCGMSDFFNSIRRRAFTYTIRSSDLSTKSIIDIRVIIVTLIERGGASTTRRPTGSLSCDDLSRRGQSDDWSSGALCYTMIRSFLRRMCSLVFGFCYLVKLCNLLRLRRVCMCGCGCVCGREVE